MGWIQDILKPVLAKIKQDIGAVDTRVQTIETNLTQSSLVVPYGKFVVHKADGNTGDDLEPGDIGMGWITPTTWIQGCYVAGGSGNLDTLSWNIINQIDKDPEGGIFGPVFGEEFD